MYFNDNELKQGIVINGKSAVTLLEYKSHFIKAHMQHCFALDAFQYLFINKNTDCKKFQKNANINIWWK